MDTQLAKTGGASLSLIPRDIGQAKVLGTMLAESQLVPEHLRGKPADCFLIVCQATRWDMDSLAVAQKTSLINGRLMYEGQLVAALINTRAPLQQRLQYDYANLDGGDMRCVVSGTIIGEDEPRKIQVFLSKGKAGSKNDWLWNRQPEQQLAYLGARVWCRRHMPELILGVYTPDEMPEDDPQHQGFDDAKDVTETDRAAAPPVAKGAAAARAAAEKQGAQAAEEAIDTSGTEAAKEEEEARNRLQRSKKAAKTRAANKAKKEAEEKARVEAEAKAQEETTTETGDEPLEVDATPVHSRETSKRGDVFVSTCIVVDMERITLNGKPGIRANLTGDFQDEVLSFQTENTLWEESQGEGIPMVFKIEIKKQINSDNLLALVLDIKNQTAGEQVEVAF